MLNAELRLDLDSLAWIVSADIAWCGIDRRGFWDVVPEWTPRPRFESAVNELALEGENYLNETLVSYVHTGFVGLSLGWEL